MARKTQYNYYDDNFKATAVTLADIDGIYATDVAEALDIHPIMLYRWRKELKDGRIMAKKKKIRLDTKTVTELKRLRKLEKEYAVLQEEHALSLMCRVYNVTVSGYRSWKRRGVCKRMLDDEMLFGHILNIYYQFDQIYGSPKIHQELRKQGIYVGAKRVARIMREYNLKAIKARLYRTEKAQSNSTFRANIKFELLDKIVTGINQVWRGDITDLRLNGKWKYLSTIMDHHSRRLIAWSLSDNRDAKLTIRTLERAVRNRGKHPGLIFHTDQGIEYAAFSFQKRLRQYGFIQSMNRSDKLNDNAQMESFYHQFKTEKVRKKEYTSNKMLKSDVVSDMGFYNYRRSHSSLGYIFL